MGLDDLEDEELPIFDFESNSECQPHRAFNWCIGRTLPAQPPPVIKVFMLPFFLYFCALLHADLPLPYALQAQSAQLYLPTFLMLSFLHQSLFITKVRGGWLGLNDDDSSQRISSPSSAKISAPYCCFSEICSI